MDFDSVLLETIYGALEDNKEAENHLKLETILKLERITHDFQIYILVFQEDLETEKRFRKICDDWNSRLEMRFKQDLLPWKRPNFDRRNTY